MDPEMLLAKILTAAGEPLLAEMATLFGNESANCKLTEAVGRPRANVINIYGCNFIA
jgi:hypothetical protein